MTSNRYEELRANAMSDTALLSASDVVECLDEIARLTREVEATRGMVMDPHRTKAFFILLVEMLTKQPWTSDDPWNVIECEAKLLLAGLSPELARQRALATAEANTKGGA
jgi:hypothetical protein